MRYSDIRRVTPQPEINFEVEVDQGVATIARKPFYAVVNQLLHRVTELEREIERLEDYRTEQQEF